MKEIKHDAVYFFDSEKNKWELSLKEDFLKRWSGIILLAEAEAGAGEKDYAKKIKEERILRFKQYFAALSIPVIIVIAGIAAAIQIGAGAILPLLFSFLTFTGCTTAGLLLWYEIDRYYPILQYICGAGKNADCGSVLQSKASKIAGISWSVIGFSYFAGSLLMLLLEGITNHQALFVVSWMNRLAIPYVFFSVYYQWRVVKQWCILCLVVQGILIFQQILVLIAAWTTLISIEKISPDLVLRAATAFIIPLLIATVAVPVLRKARENSSIRRELQRLRRNPQIFESLLEKQKHITEIPAGLGISIGNPNAAYNIIKVCNPYCGPCARAHAPVEELVHSNPEVKVQILFAASNNENDIRNLPAMHLLALAEKNDGELMKRALDDWYLAETKDYSAFADKYPVSGELKGQAGKIAAMESWCNSNRITFTPTFFINGYQLPEMFSVNDLKYLLLV